MSTQLLHLLAAAVRKHLSATNSPARPNPTLPDLSHLPETFVIADLETTGLDPDKHEIIEISAIKAHRDADMHDTFASLVRCEKRIPQKITRITGISQAMLDSEGRAPDTIIPQFLDFIGNYRLVFYNAPFDLPFLRKAVARMGHTITNPVSDALAMARQAWPDMESYRLADLAQAGGLDTTGAHRALKDCTLTLTVYVAAACRLGRLA
jgi:DNA polymerase III epsilon subunit family exonuclease